MNDLSDAMNEYRVQDVSFEQQRECELLSFLVQALEDKDSGAFISSALTLTLMHSHSCTHN